MPSAMDVRFTAVYRKVPEGFIAFVEELPGANTQGAGHAEQLVAADGLSRRR